MGKMNVSFKVGHKIQPRQFESLEVALHVEEEIEVGDSSTREEELDKFVGRVVEDFKRSFSSTLESLGVQDKPVSVTQKDEDGTVKTAALPVSTPVATVKVEAKKSLAPKKDELDEFFDGV